ncbi:hypothetical protein [Phycicoccus sp. SLBN-51]|uniref:hypothetical protein n=1 Tax=Phycicoccus sp. SLBN-51 TaxID=2768447 RepID=UPI00115442D6|nr:hypothetical protein [Phycicoccus sp. SLBN-51]
MHHTIWFRDVRKTPLEDVLNAVAGAVVEAQFEVAPAAGIRTADVIAAIRTPLLTLGFDAPHAGLQLEASTDGTAGVIAADGFDRQFGVSVHVHGGRALTNNEALYSVLRAAAADAVLACALVVPERYKGGQCALPIVRQLQQLAAWEGVTLNLDAACVIAY